MHFWHHPVAFWEGFTSQRDREIYITYNVSHKKLDLSHKKYMKTFHITYCNWSGHPNNRPPVMAAITTPHSNCSKVKQWASVMFRNQIEGENEPRVRLFVFAARRRQQIKMTECKRASQGRAKESISGEKQSSERQINVQNNPALQQQRKHNPLLWLEDFFMIIWRSYLNSGLKNISVKYRKMFGFYRSWPWKVEVVMCDSCCIMSLSVVSHCAGVCLRRALVIPTRRKLFSPLILCC